MGRKKGKGGKEGRRYIGVGGICVNGGEGG